MTIKAIIQEATKKLSDSGIITARLDCLILLEDTLAMSRAIILAHDEQEIPRAAYEAFDQAVTRRCAHEPLAYIRGRVMFYGREFVVTPEVLVPRPETEAIIDLVKKLPLKKNPSIADIGTGSGCIGVTLSLELPGSSVDLYDISDEALAIARQNSQLLQAQTSSHKSDLLTSLHGAYDVIVTNLPYVPDAYPINEAAEFEPALALFAGADGLNAYRDFWQQVSLLEHKPQYILTESLPSQHHALAMMARHHGYVLEKTSDFIQLLAAE